MQICFSSCWPTDTTNLDVRTVAVQTITVFWLPLIAPVLPALLLLLCTDDGTCAIVSDTLLQAETSAGRLWSVSWKIEKYHHQALWVMQICFSSCSPTDTTNLDVRTVAVQTVTVFWLPLVVPVSPALLLLLCTDNGTCALVPDTLLLAETSAGWLWSVSWKIKKYHHQAL